MRCRYTSITIYLKISRISACAVETAKRLIGYWLVNSFTIHKSLKLPTILKSFYVMTWQIQYPTYGNKRILSSSLRKNSVYITLEIKLIFNFSLKRTDFSNLISKREFLCYDDTSHLDKQKWNFCTKFTSVHGLSNSSNWRGKKERNRLPKLPHSV